MILIIAENDQIIGADEEFLNGSSLESLKENFPSMSIFLLQSEKGSFEFNYNDKDYIVNKHTVVMDAYNANIYYLNDKTKVLTNNLEIDNGEGEVGDLSISLDDEDAQAVKLDLGDLKSELKNIDTQTKKTEEKSEEFNFNFDEPKIDEPKSETNELNLSLTDEPKPETDELDLSLTDEPKPETDELDLSLTDEPKSETDELDLSLTDEPKSETDELDLSLTDEPKSETDELDLSLTDEPKPEIDEAELEKKLERAKFKPMTELDLDLDLDEPVNTKKPKEIDLGIEDIEETNDFNLELNLGLDETNEENSNIIEEVEQNLNIETNENDIVISKEEIEKDLKKASQDLGIDDATIQEFFNDFKQQLIDEKETFLKAISEKDFETLHKSAHKLKGVALNLRLDKFAELLKKADDYAKIDHDLAKTEHIIKNIYTVIEGKEETTSDIIPDNTEIKIDLDVELDQEDKEIIFPSFIQFLEQLSTKDLDTINKELKHAYRLVPLSILKELSNFNSIDEAREFITNLREKLQKEIK